MFKNKNIHMLGIGGISVSAIAKMLYKDNKITGYDINQNDITKELINLGINVSNKCNLDNVYNADIIIYSSAIDSNNKELIYAKELNKEIYERSTFLGLLSKEYENRLCITGTHGKSTTTAMVSSIFLEAMLDPTIHLGAYYEAINGNLHIGSKKYFIMEACEYVDSFLNFYPTSTIITNIDSDHLNYFNSIDNIINSFNKYTDLVPDNGYIIINNDDINKINIINKNIISIGINNISDYMAKNISNNTFDLYYKNDLLTSITLKVSGIHNIYNALSAIALSNIYINDINVIKKGIENYNGIKRRFEYIGKYNNTLVYDDYAHHPKEILTTYDNTTYIKHNKSWAIFSPHTYSRTKNHLDEFAISLSKFDNIIIAPIYAAREINTYNISEYDLVLKIKKLNKNVIYLDSYEKIIDYIKANVEENDLVVTIGAGDIDIVAKKIIEEIN